MAEDGSALQYDLFRHGTEGHARYKACLSYALCYALSIARPACMTHVTVGVCLILVPMETGLILVLLASYWS